MNKLFTPIQIALAALIAGPLAVTFMFQENFISMGNEEAARRSKIYGVLSALLVSVSITYLPDNWPGYLSSAIYVAISMIIVSKSQYQKQEIADSALYSFQSNWSTLGVTLVGMLLFIILLFATGYALAKIGIA